MSWPLPSRHRRLFRRGHLLRFLLGALGVVALLAGCGVSLQDQAEPLPAGAIPTLSPSGQAPQTIPTSPASTVFFVAGRELEGVEQPIASTSAGAVMDALALGPPAERSDDLRTLLVDRLTGPMIVVTSVSPANQVNLQTTPSFFLLSANDQTLLLGQVVLSMDKVGLTQVLFSDSTGSPMAVSLPNGVVRVGAVTAADFKGMIRR